MIEARDLHKSFGARRAVDGVSFVARDGQITGLLGANGAGKTTTLRMLYTLIQPDSGSIVVDGLDARAQPLAVRQRLGVLPDALSATVEAVMDVEAGDVSPAASKAFTVYVYVVPAARPVSV